MTIRRTLITALAAAALISPSAQAEGPPVDGGGDMHASTALAAAEARAPQASPPDMHASTAEAAARARENRADFNNQQPPAARPATSQASDDGSPVPVIPIVAGVLGVLIAGLAAHYGVRRFGHRSRIPA